jgi:hypothetical protein
MKKQEFVNTIKIVVSDGSVNAIKSILQKPSGRKPDEKLRERSIWYNDLNKKDKDFVNQVIKESVDQAIFNFMCVLDGVSTIEGHGEIGVLKLYYEKGEKKVLLNDFEEDFLHDIYNS